VQALIHPNQLSTVDIYDFTTILHIYVGFKLQCNHRFTILFYDATTKFIAVGKTATRVLCK
jgi:hypothetical protein